ncbi:DJ-1/PfpI family protein [Candidatus Lokiarchaeum ossiferum]|uniref:DJ-1/PfpI family protein n=1 Tax=Candidatus Lokiarchaeum ossiferum TaxID=2951803 RepID=UPI00352C491D
MKFAIVLYDNWSDFEVTILTLLFRKYADMITIGFGPKQYVSEGQFKVLVDKKISEVDPNELDFIVIPGGDPVKYLGDHPETQPEFEALNSLLHTLNDQKKLIAAICGGPVFVYKSGLLKNKTWTSGIGKEDQEDYPDGNNTDGVIEVDGNLITSKGNAYVEFAVEVAKWMKLFKSEGEIIEDMKWLKNQQ